ncbi:hypothetical protein [Curtobacterium flaccumfaciens]|uniref:hypothetical protein n=1 Tax=Curtobacterium flaccumfaciens TaxID=2035 RepID=UPI000FFEC57D|nr:hypothetical protein [Curtobacterium flaccumfaciens]MCS0646934.1 hypothetical protein [Curtobacterium flaccumfaciens pv. flaccumfaciens]MCS6524529.1 hypothetical protein [Curtobacterium flaccumfaciens pv. flaccumfaciens]MCS6529675.1 hypothetical protein [Curtobacterium flaccumfaciens pv. flaccumfaciens]NUU11125.1 hypothetical protein [Curtobacterium flaccumfaciens]RXF84604.1 hypothetical protein CffCFBP3418_05795 [Curtobacterium flaccumfaciens pv. flaccumfaciens]
MTNTPPPYPGSEPQPNDGQPNAGQPNGQQYPQQPAGQPYAQQQQPAGQPYAQAAPAGAAPYAPPPKSSSSRGKRVLISVLGVVVAVVVAFLVRQGLNAAFSDSTEEKVSKAVEQIREQSDLPKQVDSVTTWTGIEAEGAAIHYDYTVSSNVDPASITEGAIRDAVGPNLCSNSETKKLLDEDVDMRYTYKFEGSSKTVDTTFTKADCS